MFRDAELISASDGSFANLAEAVDASLREKIRCRQLEARYHTPAGEERTLDITVSSVQTPDTEVLGAACLINDRTEMTRIRRQQELRGEMSAEMALELRNSLTTISGYAQQLAASRDADLARQLAADIAAEAAHLDRTIGGFLASAKAARAGGKVLMETKSMLPFVFKAARLEEMEHRMKRIAYVFLAEIVLSGMLVTLAGAQSEPLGDYARSIRKEDKKEVGKKYDNDNLPTTDKISIVGNCCRVDRARGRQSRLNVRCEFRETSGFVHGRHTRFASSGRSQEAGRRGRAEGNRPMETEIRGPESQGRSAHPRTGRGPARIPPACRRVLRRRRATACATRVHGTKKTRNTNNRSPRNKRPWTTPRRHWTIMKEQGRKAGVSARDRE